MGGDGDGVVECGAIRISVKLGPSVPQIVLRT